MCNLCGEGDGYDRLTPRDIRILQMKAAGYTHQKIALAENLSRSYTQNLICSIKKKMNAKNITHAVVMAWMEGLIV